MGIFDSDFGNWFSGDYGFGGGGGGSSWTDYLGGDWGDGTGSFLGGLFDGGGSGGSGGSSSGGGVLSSLFGGGSSGGSMGSIFGGLLSGLGASAGAVLSGKDLKDSIKYKGEQDRLTLADQAKYNKEQALLEALQGRKGVDFEASLKDYYTQQDKRRKRIALDTYGQFSTIDKLKPGYVNTPMPETPAKPGYT